MPPKYRYLEELKPGDRFKDAIGNKGTLLHLYPGSALVNFDRKKGENLTITRRARVIKLVKKGKKRR